MSEDKKEIVKIGDLLAPGSRALPTAHFATVIPDRLLTSLADQYGVSSEELRRDLNGKSALAKVARGLIGLADPKKPKRGRRSKDAEKWQLVLLVNALVKHNGGNVSAAIRQIVSAEAVDDPEDRRPGTLTKKYNRAKTEWSEVPDISPLAGLFIDPPPKKGDRKKV